MKKIIILLYLFILTSCEGCSINATINAQENYPDSFIWRIPDSDRFIVFNPDGDIIYLKYSLGIPCLPIKIPYRWEGQKEKI